MTEITSETTQ